MNQQLDREAREALAPVLARIIREMVPTKGQCDSYEGADEAHGKAHPIHPFYHWYLDEATYSQKLRFLAIEDVDAFAQAIADGFMGVFMLDDLEVAA